MTNGVQDPEAFKRLVRALEPWLDQVVIVGGWAHQLYRLHPEALELDYPPLLTLDKEAIARQIVAEQKIGSGPVCVIKSVEPCWSYDIYRSREEKKLQLVKRPRQCLFLYHYQIGFSRGFRFRCDLHKRTGMAVAANGLGRFGVRAAGQLLPLAGQL